MTLDQLRSFRAIVETGSFRAAADRMHRTQPAITQQIKGLERETGHTLIDRKTARPTPAGQRLYERACPLLSDVESIRRGMRDFDETESRELRLGTSDTTALYVLPPIVRRFMRAEPAARLRIINRPTEAIAELVLRGELDLGIVTLPVRKPQLEEHLLMEQELVLVTSRRHALAGKHSIALNALGGETFLMLEEQTRTGALMRAHFRAHGFDPRVALDSGSFEVIKRYVGEGIGVSFLPRNTITKQDANLVTIRVPGLPRVAIGAIQRKGAYQTKAARLFREILVVESNGSKNHVKS
ncbi:MAG: LysR family transcriptional regulator [Candidatus Hydrogenedentes bacterium]|nr:LysR family transcriptional regulator [Candidatus Hydrogenedentota bacterium]